MKVYISGQITGLPENEARLNFSNAKKFVQQFGNIAINPFDLNPFLGIKKYWFYMISDIWALIWCDAIYMLRYWNDSRGAKIEHYIAKKLNKIIIYEQ